jgi:hypothetical protein
VWTNAFDIPVGEEPPALRAVALLDYLRVNVPVLDKSLYDGLGPAVVRRVVRHPEMVKDDTHPLEGLVKMSVELFRECTRCYSRILGAHDNRCPVIIGTADEHHRLATSPQVSDIEIRRDIGPDVPEMAGAVGIGKAAGHEDGSVTHHYLF